VWEMRLGQFLIIDLDEALISYNGHQKVISKSYLVTIGRNSKYFCYMSMVQKKLGRNGSLNGLYSFDFLTSD